MTKSEVASEYPSYLTLDRGSFTLRLWKNLKLATSPLTANSGDHAQGGLAGGG